MRGRGSKKCLFCQVYKNCQHKGGGQKWQNSVHVVVKCPLITIQFSARVPTCQLSLLVKQERGDFASRSKVQYLLT